MSYETLISPLKSSSKWLNRLRSTRGFPDSDHIDLEHFLTTISIDPEPSTDKNPQSDHSLVTGKHVDTETVQDHDSITTLLSELFHMGDFQHTSRIKTKKSSRKQHSPRICPAVSSPLNVTLNSRNKVKEAKIIEEEDEEKCDWDVSGYSQTDVTVIDTSVPSWKFEKVLYRRKNIWKVGNKKGKGLVSGDTKKRKECVSEKKMKKKKKKKLMLCTSLKYVDKKDDMIRSKSAQGHEQGKTIVAAYEKKQDN